MRMNFTSAMAIAAAVVLLVAGPVRAVEFTGGPSVRVLPNDKFAIRWIGSFVGDGKAELFTNPDGTGLIDSASATNNNDHTVEFTVGGILTPDTTYFQGHAHRSHRCPGGPDQRAAAVPAGLHRGAGDRPRVRPARHGQRFDLVGRQRDRPGPRRLRDDVARRRRRRRHVQYHRPRHHPDRAVAQHGLPVPREQPARDRRRHAGPSERLVHDRPRAGGVCGWGGAGFIECCLAAPDKTSVTFGNEQLFR